MSFRLSGGSMTISFKGETTSELARRVIPERDRPVVDKTGLSGTFDGELTFAPEPLPAFLAWQRERTVGVHRASGAVGPQTRTGARTRRDTRYRERAEADGELATGACLLKSPWLAQISPNRARSS